MEILVVALCMHTRTCGVSVNGATVVILKRMEIIILFSHNTSDGLLSF